MPSPDYPSRIRNVGDNINIFDKDTVVRKDNYYINNDGVQKTSTESGYTQSYTSVKPNTTYTIQGSIGAENNSWAIYFYDENTEWIERIMINANTPYTFTTPNNCNYIRIQYRLNSIDFNTIKIEKGSQATGYSKFGCGSITEKISNKNFLNILANHSAGDSLTSGGLTITFNADNTLTVNGTNTASVTFDIIGSWSSTTNYIDLDINKSYRLSINASKYTISPTIRDKNNGKTRYVFGTINGYAGITDFALTFGKGTYNNAIFILQLEEGTIQTDLIPHAEQLVTIPLSEGQVLHEGDVLSDKYYQKRKTIILDGTENWLATGTQYSGFFSAYIVQSDMKRQDIFSGDLFSNYFKEQSFQTKAEGITKALQPLSYDFIILRISNDKATTLAEFKSWLAAKYSAGTPVTVEYELATPIVTELTEEQKEVLESIHSYEGTTYIECQDEIVPEITAEYYYNNEINNHYAKRIDDLEAELNEKIKLLDARLALLE